MTSRIRETTYVRSLPPVLRWFCTLIGLRWLDRGEWNFTWGSINWRRSFGAGLILFDDEDSSGGRYSIKIAPIFFSLFINTAFRRAEPPKEVVEAWGFSFIDNRFDGLFLNWGDAVKIVYMPWHWHHVITEVRGADGAWRKKIDDYEERRPGYSYADFRQVTTHPYSYRLRSGVRQEVDATIFVERRTWRWLWFGTKVALPFPRKTVPVINVTFSGEVGERSGSWKGGTIGCTFAIEPFETAVEALRRMEVERKF